MYLKLFAWELTHLMNSLCICDQTDKKDRTLEG